MNLSSTLYLSSAIATVNPIAANSDIIQGVEHLREYQGIGLTFSREWPGEYWNIIVIKFKETKLHIMLSPLTQA